MSMFAALIAAALCNADAPAVESAPADAWPNFRGTTSMTGRSSATLPGELQLLWKVPLKEPVDAGAVIADGVAYVVTLKGSAFALDLKTGERKWQFQVAPSEGNFRDGVASSPTIVGDLLVFGDEGGIVYALDRKNGDKKWTAKTEGAIHSSATAVGERIVIGSDDFHIYCFDRAGNQKWKAETGERVFCSPVVVEGHVVTASCDGKARLISLETGMEAKSAPLEEPVASTPAKAGDRLYVGTMGDAVVCLDAKTLQPVWRMQPEGAAKFFASPAVGDEVAVFGCRQRRVVALSRADGAVKWTFRARGNVDSSPVVVGDRVFFGSEDGRIYGLNLASGDKVWEHVCGERVTAAPAVASGKLVVSDGEGNVFCFGAK